VLELRRRKNQASWSKSRVGPAQSSTEEAITPPGYARCSFGPVNGQSAGIPCRHIFNDGRSPRAPSSSECAAVGLAEQTGLLVRGDNFSRFDVVPPVDPEMFPSPCHSTLKSCNTASILHEGMIPSTGSMAEREGPMCSPYVFFAGPIVGPPTGSLGIPSLLVHAFSLAGEGQYRLTAPSHSLPNLTRPNAARSMKKNCHRQPRPKANRDPISRTTIPRPLGGKRHRIAEKPAARLLAVKP